MAKTKNKTNQKKKTDFKSGPHGKKSSDFNPDYSDVKKDLKRIGILAGFLIIVLIVLSFFIN